MIYRDAKFEDIPIIVDMWQKLRKELALNERRGDCTGYYIIELLNRFKNPLSVNIVVDQGDGKIIAFAIGNAQTETYSDTKKVFWCGDLYVEPEYRGKGILDAMIKIAENKGQHLGCHEMSAKVKYGLEDIYIRKGFVPEQVILRKTIKDGEEGIHER